MSAEDRQRLIQRSEALRSRTTQDDFVTLISVFSTSDIRHELRRLDLPSLVLHPAHAVYIDQAAAANTAALIRNGRFSVLNGPSFLGDPKQALALIESLLAEGPAAPANEVLAEPAAGLSAREIEVLSLVAVAKTNREIADELFFSA